MSGFCRKPRLTALRAKTPVRGSMGQPRDGSRQTRGFTLLEVVVVLVIVSMTAALAFPRLSTMAASFTFATERDQFEQTLNGLPYAALRSNADQILLGTYTDAGRDTRRRLQGSLGDTLDPSLRTTSLLQNTREHLPPVTAAFVPFPLPAGWRIEVADPIYYRGTGYCSGGRVDLHIGGLQYTYDLKAPLCRARLVE